MPTADGIETTAKELRAQRSEAEITFNVSLVDFGKELILCNQQAATKFHAKNCTYFLSGGRYLELGKCN